VPACGLKFSVKNTKALRLLREYGDAEDG